MAHFQAAYDGVVTLVNYMYKFVVFVFTGVRYFVMHRGKSVCNSNDRY